MITNKNPTLPSPKPKFTIPKTAKSSKFPLWPILLIMAFLLGAATGFGVFYYLTKNDEKIEEKKEETKLETTKEKEDEIIDESNDEQSAENEEKKQLNTFEGECISIEIPKSWKIQEFLNGAEYNMLRKDATYRVCTGLKVLNSKEEVVFELQTVAGAEVTGSGYWKFYHFADTDPDYQQAMVNAGAIEGVTTHTIDLSNASYAEFNLLSKKVRRVGTEPYIDTSDTLTFDAACRWAYKKNTYYYSYC